MGDIPLTWAKLLNATLYSFSQEIQEICSQSGELRTDHNTRLVLKSVLMVTFPFLQVDDSQSQLRCTYGEIQTCFPALPRSFWLQSEGAFFRRTWPLSRYLSLYKDLEGRDSDGKISSKEWTEHFKNMEREVHSRVCIKLYCLTHQHHFLSQGHVKQWVFLSISASLCILIEPLMPTPSSILIHNNASFVSQNGEHWSIKYIESLETVIRVKLSK